MNIEIAANSQRKEMKKDIETIILTPAEWARLMAKLPELKKCNDGPIIVDGKPLR